MLRNSISRGKMRQRDLSEQDQLKVAELEQVFCKWTLITVLHISMFLLVLTGEEVEGVVIRSLSYVHVSGFNDLSSHSFWKRWCHAFHNWTSTVMTLRLSQTTLPYNSSFFRRDNFPCHSFKKKKQEWLREHNKEPKVLTHSFLRAACFLKKGLLKS